MENPVEAEGAARYPATGGRATFTRTFDEPTDVIGYPVADLWIEVAGGQDADLFLRLDKLDADGQFQGVINVEGLRVSHREVDVQRSTEFMVYRTHRQEQLLEPGERVLVRGGIAPIAMRFGAGDQLRLQVAGDMDGGEPSPPELAMASQSSSRQP